MEINVGELINLIKNHPVFPGDTISHKTMRELTDSGFATRNEEGNHVPTDAGRYLFSQLSALRLNVSHKIDLVK